MTVESLPTRDYLRALCEHMDALVPELRCLVDAYVEGRLIDGQAIADAWEEYKEFCSQSGAMAVLRMKMDDALRGQQR